MNARIRMLLAVGLLGTGSAVADDHFTVEDFAALDKVDVHVHINTADPALIEQAAADNFRLLTINVDYPDFPPLAQQRELAHALVSAHPDRVAYAASFSVAGWDRPDWSQQVLKDLAGEFAHGAVAVKVWKNIGMQLRDAHGRLVMVDDPQLDPVFAFIRQRGRVLIGHQGEPHNCWLPLEQMTVNNDREYFREHPQYHMYLHPELPSYEDQMAARDRMLAKNPGLRFVGAHLASLEWDVDRLAAFLEQHPTARVDLAARLGQVQYQSNRDYEKVRQFFIRYQDRILYGTDLTQQPGSQAAQMRTEVHETWLRDWQYLNTDAMLKVPELDEPVRGLALPKEVVRKIYADNARAWLGNPWRTSAARVQGAGIRIEYDAHLRSRVLALDEGREVATGPFSASESLQTSTGTLRDFVFEAEREEAVQDTIGHGTRHWLSGRAGNVRKSVEVTLYDGFPRWAVVQTHYTNLGSRPLRVTGWTNAHYTVAAGDSDSTLWSYQSGSYARRPDWVVPLKPGFHQNNYQGMNASDYGGGTPVVDIWRRDIGLAVGHLELQPELVSLPVKRSSLGGASLAVQRNKPATLGPGETLDTLRTFVSVHHGDYFRTLTDYRRLMVLQGVSLPTAPPSAFEPMWCAWGYGRHFQPEQVIATLPVVQRLGFGWVTLDDGWQSDIGDWTPNATKFPHGDADMRALVQSIHAAGMKAQLWWSPLSVHPSSQGATRHPDWLLRNADQSTRRISWWHSDYLCPAYDPVRSDAQDFVRKALGDWGFDGLKIDGQHLNAAPRCFNSSHHHEAPEAAPQGVPGFFRSVWSAAHEVNSQALVEICPCGTTYSFFTMPYLNMTVASDPESSWQVRHKGKTLQALAGGSAVYFGDHVELTQGGEDFASQIGVGAVPGSNFVWPGAPGRKDPKLLLTPSRERLWAFWLKIYQDKRLAEGEYRGDLYDIGFDRPEAHAIAKGDHLFYAFFASHFEGAIELRGLEARAYRVHDYESDRDLGRVTGPVARLDVLFAKHLLLEAIPE
jgi:alpha-galactosidase